MGTRRSRGREGLLPGCVREEVWGSFAESISGCQTYAGLRIREECSEKVHRKVRTEFVTYIGGGEVS